MHDDMQMIRQLEFEKCLKDGQIPCRWTPDLDFEYGSPLFNFYPPMPYIVGQAIRTTGVSFVNTIKVTAIIQIILAATFMYLLASSIFGPTGGILSALFYTYAPYHALNIYIRGAMNEAWAAVFFPLIFYFSRKLILEKKYKFVFGLAISFAGLFLSHNPMLLTFAPILIIWCLFWLLTTFNKKNTLILNLKKQITPILKLLFSATLAFCLAAFFTLPVLIETNLINVNELFTNYFSFSGHFASLYQLFISNFWGDGASTWGMNDGISFMIGYMHWIIPSLILLFSIFLLIRKKSLDKKIIISLFVLIMGLFATFMIHNKSTFIWQIFSPIQKIQFPWRFLNHATFLFSLSIGVLPFIFKKYFNKKIITIITASIIVVLILINVNYFKATKPFQLTDKDKFSGINWEQQISAGISDYLPKTASATAKTTAKAYIDNVDPKKALVELSGQKKGTDWIFFNVSVSQDSKVIISQLAFPNFEITDNGQKIDYQIEPELGRMVINLKTGDHQIYVKLKDTPIRTISNYISLVAWIFVLGYFSLPLWNKLTLKK